MKKEEDRDYWLDMMLKIADPVLNALANDQLKVLMPVESVVAERDQVTYLEAFGRLVCGMAPWLETGPRSGAEGEAREEYADLVRLGIEMGTDPNAHDYFNFEEGKQPVVDTAFLAHAIVRAPEELYEKLSTDVKVNLITALKKSRSIKPNFTNWLLFSAMIETALHVCGEEADLMRIDYAVRQHEQWYLGDGMYGDGPVYHADYYNSFVIQPMLVDIINQMADQSKDWHTFKEPINKRAQRYATVQERSISPEGTFPVVGRSIAYRTGAFQHLAQMALQQNLAQEIHPAQVRCALTAVMKRMLGAEGTFDEKGWLTIGFCGHQPGIGEGYISTGSLYLCSTVFLPLGLAVEDPFWQGERQWTTQKAWSGEDFKMDKSLIN